jgi:SAM-dependent methyltransferase
MMPDLMSLVQRSQRADPWVEGEKIPWNEPAFSRRMLQVHLSQEHDWASRRAVTIRKQVDWIDREILSGRPARILDLGCGPGLYASQLAQRGHTCRGVDFSPSSIDYAREIAQKSNLPCTYELQDIREADFGSGCDLVMFIFGEFNVFKPEDAARILRKARVALRPGGSLLLEVHTYETVHDMGKQPAAWHSEESGLFSDRPHLYLQENFWDEARSVATLRYFIVDAQTGRVTRYAASTQAYTQAEYVKMLTENGFQNVDIYPSLTGEADPSQAAFFAIRALA